MNKHKFNVGDRIICAPVSSFARFYRMGKSNRITGTIKDCEWDILFKEYRYHVLFDNTIYVKSTNYDAGKELSIFEYEIELLASENEEPHDKPWGDMTDEEIGRMADKNDVINYFGFYQEIVAEAIGLAYKKGYMRAKKNRPFKLGEKHEN